MPPGARGIYRLTPSSSYSRSTSCRSSPTSSRSCAMLALSAAISPVVTPPSTLVPYGRLGLDLRLAAQQMGIAMLARARLLGQLEHQRAGRASRHFLEIGFQSARYRETIQAVAVHPQLTLASAGRATSAMPAGQRRAAADGARVPRCGRSAATRPEAPVLSTTKVWCLRASSAICTSSSPALSTGWRLDLLVAPRQQGVQGKRIIVRRRELLFHQYAEDAGFQQGQGRQRGFGHSVPFRFRE